MSLDEHETTTIVSDNEITIKQVNIKSNDNESKEHYHMRGESVLLLIFMLILFQYLIHFWRKKHHRSFFIITWLCLWLFPIIICIKLIFIRMIIIWSIFSILMLILLYKANQKNIDRKIPRYIYTFFYYLYKITSFLSIFGYTLCLCDFFGISIIFFNTIFSQIGFIMLFYGLYYGVLSRDTAYLCTELLNKNMGFFNPNGFPTKMIPQNICAVCNQRLTNHNIFNIATNSNESNTPNNNNNNNGFNRRMNILKERELDKKDEYIKQQKVKMYSKYDNEIKLECGHIFHGFCIRGWVMIGKRDVCPICFEKVNFKGIFVNPWHKQDRMWSQLLDGIRYLIVWNPIILFAVQLIFNVTGISFKKKVNHDIHDHYKFRHRHINHNP